MTSSKSLIFVRRGKKQKQKQNRKQIGVGFSPFARGDQKGVDSLFVLTTFFRLSADERFHSPLHTNLSARTSKHIVLAIISEAVFFTLN